jgi:hypothetical protein
MLRLGVPDLEMATHEGLRLGGTSADSPNAKDAHVALEGLDLDPGTEAEGSDKRLGPKINMHASYSIAQA